MALFDMGGMLMGGAMNPDLLAQQMAAMNIAVPTPEVMQQAQAAVGDAAPQNFNDILNPQPAQQAGGQQVAGLSIGPANSMVPPTTPPVPPMSAVQPAPQPAVSPGRLDSLRPPVPQMIPPGGGAAISGSAVPAAAPIPAPIPAPPPVVAPTPAPAPVPPSLPPSGGGIGSDYVAGGGAYPTAAASPATSPAGTPTQSLSQRLLSSLAGVKAPPVPQTQVPYPPAAPRPSGQITPSATLIDLLMKAQQVAPVASLGQRVGR